MIRRSIARAVRESISCPQSARSSACATVATRSTRRPCRCRDRSLEQLVVLEAAQELGVVVVEREHPAQALDGLLARPAHDDRAVAPLRREHLHVADDRA